jgi:YtkA-like
MTRAPASPARVRAALAGFALLSVSPVALACELPGGAAQTLKSSTYTVLYRTAPLKVGEHFAVDFAVCPAPEAVRVDAWMPEHRHGMNYRPEVRAQGGGRYRAEGLMLHMAGRWELVFEVRSAGRTERLAQSLRLE